MYATNLREQERSIAPSPSTEMNQDDASHTSLCRDFCLHPKLHYHIMTEISAKQELNSE